MSNFDGASNVISFVAGTTKVIGSGNRLSVVSYKVREGGEKKESKCVSIPELRSDDVMNRFEDLVPHVTEYLKSVQDKIVRGLIDSGSDMIATSDVSIDACIEYLTASSECGGRLTKVALETWFTQELEEKLTVRLADRLGVSDTPTSGDMDKISGILASYRSKITALAGGKTSYSPKIATSLIAAIELIDVDGGIAARLHEKLVRMRDTVVEDMLDLL